MACWFAPGWIVNHIFKSLPMNDPQPIMSHTEKLRLIKLGLLPKECVPKQKKPMKKVSDKKLAEQKEQRENSGEGDTDLQRWFRQKIKYSTGVCGECGAKVEKNVFQYAVMTIAHLLPKRDNMCPSVKTHPSNFIILCPDHHHYFDNVTWEEKEKMGCWPTVMERLIMLYDDLAPDERRHFPESVLKYMEKNKSF